MPSDLQRQRAAVRLTWGRLLTQATLRYIIHMAREECRRSAHIDRQANGDIAGLAGCYERAVSALTEAAEALAPIIEPDDHFQVIPGFEKE